MELDEAIIKALVERNLLDKNKLPGIMKIHETNNQPLEKLVVQFKLAKREDVIQIKAELLQGEPLLIDPEKINREVALTIPQSMAERYKLAGIDEAEDGKMLVAMHNPQDKFALEYVQMRTAKGIKTYVALLSDLENAWDEIYSEKAKKKKHPFFVESRYKNAQVKKIPAKLSIPGFSQDAKIITPSTDKICNDVKCTTEKLKECMDNQGQMQSIVKNIQEELQILSILSHSANDLNSILDEQKIIIKILETSARICDSAGASILMVEGDSQTLYFKEAIGEKANHLKKIRFPLTEQSVAGWVILNNQSIAINDTAQDPRHFKEIDKVLEFKTYNIACVPILWGNQILGALEVVNKRKGEYDEKILEYLGILSSQAAVALHNAAIMDQLQNFYMEVVEILIDCLEGLDHRNKDHSLSVARLASAIGKKVNLPSSNFENLCYAGFLHDIGKIKCRGENMEQHPLVGSQMLSHIKFFNGVVPIIRYHHERYDGKGYPEKLSGESIPLEARILAIAEGFYENHRQKPRHSHSELMEDLFGSVAEDLIEKYQDPQQDESDIINQDYIEYFLSQFGTAYDPQLKVPFISVIKELF